ncbi:MAG: hypothetical protein DCF16_04835 [Alphaproteobacteria bacterium]|nr:MAG: hypothetical protein DCF16_04835 [Alphaproteobacteria bacterium]
MRAAAWSQVVISFAAFVGLVFTVIFAAGAYKETRRAAIAGNRAARHAKRQADIAEQALLESRQPAVHAEVERWRIEFPNVPFVEIAIKNLGDNLAVVTGGKITMRFGKAAILSKEEVETGPYQLIWVGVKALRTGDSFKIKVPCLQLRDFEQARDAFASITTDIRSPTFYCVGWVEYRDQWRNEYEEPVVFLYHPAGGASEEAFWSTLNVAELRDN